MEAASIAPEDESEMPKRASANPEQPSADPADKAAADRDQFQRFLETARELGCEENFDRFEEALGRIVRARPQPSKPGKRGSGGKQESRAVGRGLKRSEAADLSIIPIANLGYASPP